MYSVTLIDLSPSNLRRKCRACLRQPWQRPLIKCIIPSMLRHERIVLIVALGLVLALGTLACWLFPVALLAAPQWEVDVVDEYGKPVEGMVVRETWQNYSVEMEGHEADSLTDVNGHVAFPAQTSEYSLLRQIAGTISALVHLNVHASYGPHATVFAVGKGLEGSAATGNFITDWRGSPSVMRSQIVVRPILQPSSTEKSNSQ
jgi:hypothetical protein